jgi:TonB family protein
MRSFTLIFLSWLLLASSAHAQDYSFRSLFEFESTRFSEPPDIGDVRADFPDAARKNGVEGRVKISFTFGADGKIRNAVIAEDLPFGAGEAVRKAVERISFTPARLNGKPVDMNASFTYTVTAFFYEDDKHIQKVKIIGKPTAEYPASQRSEGRKGTVSVSVTFYADGKIVVGRSESTLPNEFDEAAKKAAASLKFVPATHKKSKKSVNQVLWVVFEFKS